MTLVLALSVASCVNDTGITTTVTSGEGTAPPESEETTTSPPRGDPVTELPTPPAGWSCFYLDGFVAVEAGQGEQAEAELEGLITPVSAEAVLGDTPVLEQLDAIVHLFSTNGEDPLAIALALESAEIEASPLHAIGLAGHWRLKPGTDPISRPETEILQPTATLGQSIIAVVDSGLMIQRLPDWMSPEHVLYDPALDTETVDDDPSKASHGTFVTSLIRQLAPESRVGFARALPVPVGSIVGNAEQLPPEVEYVSTELHVAEALVRLLERPEMTAENVVALNLSLGTYTCDPGEDPFMVTTLAALRLWLTSFPDSQVFAAAGNEVSTSPFWPAGLSAFELDQAIPRDRMHGVGAVNETGEEVVWEGTATTASILAKAAPVRSWATNAAPGCDLLGLRGGVDLEGATVVAWSGSSFASAVMAALTVAAVPPTSVGPPVQYGYNLSSLAFERHGSCDLP